MRRIIAALSLTLAITLAGSSFVVAGDVEAEVISEAITSTLTEQAITPEGTQLHVDDLFELWGDTATGSDCERYAAVGFAIAYALNQAVIAEASREPGSPVTTEVGYAYVVLQAARVYVNELPRLYDDCLNEEYV